MSYSLQDNVSVLYTSCVPIVSFKRISGFWLHVFVCFVFDFFFHYCVSLSAIFTVFLFLILFRSHSIDQIYFYSIASRHERVSASRKWPKRLHLFGSVVAFESVDLTGNSFKIVVHIIYNSIQITYQEFKEIFVRSYVWQRIQIHWYFQDQPIFSFTRFRFSEDWFSAFGVSSYLQSNSLPYLAVPSAYNYFESFW